MFAISRALISSSVPKGCSLTISILYNYTDHQKFVLQIFQKKNIVPVRLDNIFGECKIQVETMTKKRNNKFFK